MKQDKTQIKHYVVRFYGGAFLAETSEEEIKVRDPKKIKYKKYSYGFYFFDREISKSKLGNVLESEKLNISGTYFYAGRLLTLKDVKTKMSDRKTLISNMECNHWNKVVETTIGWMLPFEKGDFLIDK